MLLHTFGEVDSDNLCTSHSETHMVTSKIKVTLLGMMLSASFLSVAQVVVVVNPANTSSLDTKTVQRIFLGKEKKFSDGSQATPINQKANGTREEFDESIVGRSSTQVSAYWSKLVFTGKGIPPAELADDAAIIAAVAADPSAIAYINAASATDAVKTVALK